MLANLPELVQSLRSWIFQPVEHNIVLLYMILPGLSAWLGFKLGRY